MSGDNQQDNFNKDRAELFEALGHPTRIKILQVLTQSPLGFSDLKREAGMDSNGLLSFHLGKLNGLVKMAEGTYVLTDDGKDALRIMIEPRKGKAKALIPVSPLKVLLVILAILLVASLAYNASLNQSQTNLDSVYHDLGNNYTELLQNYAILQDVYDQLVAHNASLNQSLTDLDYKYQDLGKLYYGLLQNYIRLEDVDDLLVANSTILRNVLEALSTTEPSPINPPVSQFQAVMTAFDEGGLDRQWAPDRILSAKLVYISYGPISFTPMGGFPSGEMWGIGILHEVNEPVSDYSPVDVNGTSYCYAWSISIIITPAEGPWGWGITMPKYVDASTGKIMM